MFRKELPIWAFICLSSLLALPTSARADTVRVTSGFLFMNGLSGPIELMGERGFSLSSHVDVVGGIFEPFNQCSFPICDPGTEVSLRGLWSGNDLTGDLTFEGQTYNDLGGLNSFTQARVEFTGSFVAPPLAPTATVTAPFSLASSSFTIPNAAGTDSILHMLLGHGTATIQLSQGFGDDPAWVVDSVRYDFSAADPVPEPATMLLVGLGIAGAARRLRAARANT